MYWCMVRISSPPYPSIPKTKNTPITPQSIRAAFQGKMSPWGRERFPSSCKLDIPLEISHKSTLSKPSSPLPLSSAKIKNKKGTRRSERACSEVGCHRATRPYLTAWVELARNSSARVRCVTISRPIWTSTSESTSYIPIRSPTTISGTPGASP
jgi:hypothetical protein